MKLKLRDAVVVVTGASSGIGRATALAFAQRGATVLLCARREAALEDVADECARRGGRALVHPLDVTDEEAVQQVASRALDELGRLDVWVNDAGVAAFGRLEVTPTAVFRRVIETNLFGQVHGARAAVRAFREQGRGVLVNVASVLGEAAAPEMSAYVASKFAIVGFSESLRQELRDAPDIHVCTVLPAAFDTAIWQHAANYTGRAVLPSRPVRSPRLVADAIVRCVRRPRAEVFVGRLAEADVYFHRVTPSVAARVLAATVDREQRGDESAPPTEGNLFAPVGAGAEATGGWKEAFAARRRKRLGAALAFAALAAPVAAMALRSR